MFEISWGELLLALGVALVFLTPEDALKMTRKVIQGWRKFKSMFDGVRHEVEQALLLDEVREATKTIRGDDGKDYESFSLDDVEDRSRPKAEARDE